MNDADKQDALANVVELAGMLHALRGLSDEVETLLAEAMKIANREGLSQAIIAEAAALSAGRVSQVVTAGDASIPAKRVSDRMYKITEWPGDALRPHRSSFTGQMTMPPYPRRRGISPR